MILYYEIYLNEDKVYECTTRDEAHEYISNKHNDLMPFLEYEPLGDGGLEAWTNGVIDIKIVRIKKGKLDINKLLSEYTEKEGKEREVKEVHVEKMTPLTPRRTQIKGEKKLTKAGEGKPKKDKNGNIWVSKKNKKGEYKWTRYYEESYENSKRKCPKNAAKNYDEGTVKKGMDGKMWQVKLLSNDTKKWFRK